MTVTTRTIDTHLRSRAQGGTGLWSAIVKYLVQSMGGDIWVDSTPGARSTFTFTLPRAEGDAPA